MAKNQKFEEDKVLVLPTVGRKPGYKYHLDVGGSRFKTFITSNSLELIAQAGAEFIECDTMAQMRNLDSRQIWALQQGYYKGVKLNGYYDKNDTPSSIIYKISSSNRTDDGGSIIEISNIKLEHNFNKFVIVSYFGVKGDNQNDDTVSMQNAANYCDTLTYRPVLILPSGFTFKTTDTITVSAGIDFIMKSPISYIGTPDKRALLIGSTTARSSQGKYKINITATNQRSTWDNDDYVGAELINIYSSEIIIEQASHFTEGIRFSGVGNNGFVYNTVIIKDIGHNKIQGHLWSTDGGWVNQNTFIGGRLQRSSTINRGKSCYGFKLSSTDGYRHNTNLFLNVSIELNDEASRDVVRDPVTNDIISIGAPNEVSLALLIENGRHNEFIIRDEGNSLTARTYNDSHNNNVKAIFSAVFARYQTRIEDLGEYPSTIFDTDIQAANQEIGWTILNIPSILDYINQYNSTNVFVQSPLRLQNRTSSGPTSNVTGVSIHSNYVEIDSTAGLGFRIDTTLKKRFNIAAEFTDLSHSGRIHIVCRDSLGAIIAPVEGLVRISGRYEIFDASNSFGGGFALSSGVSVRDLGNVMQFFSVSDIVKSVDVFFSYYTNTAQLKGFSVHSLDGYCPLIPYNLYKTKLASEAPTIPTFNGDFVFSTNPSQIGWAQKVGTWREIGGNATITNKGLVNQAAYSADTATVAAGANPTKAEFDALLAEFRDFKNKDRTSGQSASS